MQQWQSSVHSESQTITFLKQQRSWKLKETPTIQEILQPDNLAIMDLQTGKSADQNNKEVLFIQRGSTKGTTFKINVGGLVFSSLFDTGAQVSCFKYNTMATLHC